MARTSLGSFSTNHVATGGSHFSEDSPPFSRGQPLALGNVGHCQAQDLHPGDSDQYRKGLQRPLACPQSISAKACGGGGEKEPLGGSNLSSKEPTVLIQKKNFFLFFQKRLWVNLSCPQLPRGIANLLPSHFCGFQSNPNFSVH